jgi:hypothetical protein
VYAPLPSYEAETLPAVREAVVAGRDPSAHVKALVDRLDVATREAEAVR